MLDAFGREIQASPDELKAALMESTKQTQKSASQTTENTDQLKKLNEQLKTFVGDELNAEIKKLNSLLVKVTQNYSDQMKKAGKSTKAAGRETQDLAQDLDKLAPTIRATGDEVIKFSDKLQNTIRDLASGTKASVQILADSLSRVFGTLRGKTSLPPNVNKYTDAIHQIVGAIDDAFKAFKRTAGARRSAATTVNDLTGTAEKTDLIAGTIGREGKGTKGRGPDDLCKCICKCIKKLQGDEVQSGKSWFQKVFGGQTAAKGAQAAKGKGRRTQQEIADATAYDRGKTIATTIGEITGAEKPLVTAIEKIGPKVGQALGAGVSKIFGKYLGGAAEGIFDTLLKPITQELEHQENLIRTIFIQTGRDLDQTNDKVLKLVVSEQDVTETGQLRSKIQMQQLKNLRRGITDTDKLNRVTNIGLQTATRIGSNAEETADMFADWNLKLGASNNQLFIMKSGLLEVAKTTGVFGNELLKAAKNSEEFLKNMRLSGTFTAVAANNIIGLLARAEKTGTSEGARKVLGALTGSIAREDIDPRIRSALLMGTGGRGDIIQKLISGTAIEDKSSIREITRNWRKLLRAQVRQISGGRTQELGELTADEAGKLSQFFTEPIFGLKAQELGITLDNLDEIAKSFAEKMDTINKITDKTQKENERQQLILSTSNVVLDKFNKGLVTQGGNFERAFEMLKSEEDLAPLLKEIGSKGGDAIGDILRAQAKTIGEKISGTKLSDEAKKEFSSRVTEQTDKIEEVLKKARTGDKDAQKELVKLIEQLNKIQSDAAMRIETEANPVFQTNQELRKARAILEEQIGKLLAKHMPDIVKFLQEIVDWIKKNPELSLKVAGITVAVAGIAAFTAALTGATVAFTGAGGFIATFGPAGVVIAAGTALGFGLAKLLGYTGDVGDAFKDLATATQTIFGKGDIAKTVGEGYALNAKNAKQSAQLDQERARKLALLGEKGVEEAKQNLAVQQQKFLNAAKALLPDRYGGVEKFEDLTQDQIAHINKLMSVFAEGGTVGFLRDAWNETFGGTERLNREKNLLEASNDMARAAKLLNSTVEKQKATQDKLMEAIQKSPALATTGTAEAAAAATRRVTELGTNRKTRVDKLTEELGKMSPEDIAKQLHANDLTRDIANVKDPAQRKALADSLYKVIDEYTDKTKTNEEYIKALQALALVKILREAPANVSKYLGPAPPPAPGEIDWADEKFRREFEARNGFPAPPPPIDENGKPIKAKAKTDNKVSVTPVIPATDIEAEVKRKQAELQSVKNDTGIENVETNTRETAISSRQTVAILKQIGRLLAKRNKGALADAPDIEDAVFFEEVINTEWPNARHGRTVGLEFEYTDLA